MKNRKNLLWDVFTETGDIEVYLKYKEYKEYESEEKKESGNKADADKGSYNKGN